MKFINMANKISASAVSLGCMRMASLDSASVDAIIDCALENGINFFDHADIYGGGDSEKVFGDYIGDLCGVIGDRGGS